MKDGPGRRQWEAVKEKGCGCARYLLPPVSRRSRDCHDVTTTPTLLLLYLNRKALARSLGTGETCVFYLIITLFLSFPTVSFLQIGQRSRGFSACINTGGSRRRTTRTLFGFERVLVSVLVWQSGSFRISPLPDTTIHLASQHISDTEHSIWRAPFGRLDSYLGGVLPGTGRRRQGGGVAGRQAGGQAAGWEVWERERLCITD